MRFFLSFLIVLMGSSDCFAQEIDQDLLKVRAKMDSIKSFKAKIIMDVDISFINMPTKEANIDYQRGERVKFDTNDFILVPKRGFDFSLDELFKHPFITVDRGVEEHRGQSYKYINIIPTSKKADYSIASLLIDTSNSRIVRSEINTLKDGAYTVYMNYIHNSDSLPESVSVEFEVEEVKIPLNYMGSDTDIDRKLMRADGKKKGKIILQFQNYQIEYIN